MLFADFPNSKFWFPEFVSSYAWHVTICRAMVRLISVVDVVITPMNPYQPIPFHILSFAVFQSRILIYAGSNIEIPEEEKVFERKDRVS